MYRSNLDIWPIKSGKSIHIRLDFPILRISVAPVNLWLACSCAVPRMIIKVDSGQDCWFLPAYIIPSCINFILIAISCPPLQPVVVAVRIPARAVGQSVCRRNIKIEILGVRERYSRCRQAGRSSGCARLLLVNCIFRWLCLSAGSEHSVSYSIASCATSRILILMLLERTD